MSAGPSSPIVLAVYPNVSGLCYAAFEGKLLPIDWGIKTARSAAKRATLMRHAEWLVRLFTPSTLILPSRNAVMGGSRRLQKLATDIEVLATRSQASVHWYSRSEIRECFSCYGAQSKEAIAGAIARLLPDFEQHLPPVRRLWMSEDYRMGLFDAVALAVTHYQRELPRLL